MKNDIFPQFVINEFSSLQSGLASEKSLDLLVVFSPSSTSFLDFTGLRRDDVITRFEKVRDIPRSYKSWQVCFLRKQTDGTSMEGKTTRIHTNINLSAYCQ